MQNSRVDGAVQQVFADYFREHREKKNLSNRNCDIMELEDRVIAVVKQNVNCTVALRQK